MKIYHPSKTSSGMTLLEITVVIVVLLSLMSVLFVGASAWKRGSDRSNAILIIRGAQSGLRAHTNIEGAEVGPYPGLPEQIFGENRYVFNGTDPLSGEARQDGELPGHPREDLAFGFADGDGNAVPPVGTLYICTGGPEGLSDLTFNPARGDYSAW